MFPAANEDVPKSGRIRGRSRERIRTRSRQRYYHTAIHYTSDDDIGDQPAPKSIPRTSNARSEANDSTTTITDGHVLGMLKDNLCGRISHHTDKGYQTGEYKREPERGSTILPPRSSTASIHSPTYRTQGPRSPLPTSVSATPQRQPVRSGDPPSQSNRDTYDRSRAADKSEQIKYYHVRGTQALPRPPTRREERKDDDQNKASVPGGKQVRHQPHNNTTSREGSSLSGAQSRPRRPARNLSTIASPRRRARSSESSYQVVRNKAGDISYERRGRRPRGHETGKLPRKQEMRREEGEEFGKRSRSGERESEIGCMGFPGYELLQGVWDWWRGK